jgi:hypothetical protein
VRIIHLHTDQDGAQTTIVTVQDDTVAVATYFHDEDLILTEPDSSVVYDADAAEELAEGIWHAAQHARAGDVRGWDAVRRERIDAFQSSHLQLVEPVDR